MATMSFIGRMIQVKRLVIFGNGGEQRFWIQKSFHNTRRLFFLLHQCKYLVVHVFIYTKIKTNCETFIYIYKNQDNPQKARKFPLRFILKKPYTLRYGIFMTFLKLAFIYKKHDTLRYVTFLYTKSQTLRQKQDNLRY